MQGRNIFSFFRRRMRNKLGHQWILDVGLHGLPFWTRQQIQPSPRQSWARQEVNATVVGAMRTQRGGLGRTEHLWFYWDILAEHQWDQGLGLNPGARRIQAVEPRKPTDRKDPTHEWPLLTSQLGDFVSKARHTIKPMATRATTGAETQKSFYVFQTPA